MERIKTASYRNTLVNGSSSESVDCDYEVSHYGVISGKNKELEANKVGGFLIRAKPSSKNEGGVMDGGGAICSWKIRDRK